MFGKTKTDVLVVGAGPVGLLAALTLAKRGARVQIVDRQWRTGAHSFALGLHAQSLPLFEELGLLDAILAQAYPVRRVGLFEGTERKAEIALAADQDQRSCLAILRQDALEQLLEEALEQQGVSVLWNHEASRIEQKKDSVAVTIDTLEKDTVGYAVAHTEWVVARTAEVSVPWVIGADGHRSFVRRALGADYEEVGEPQHFAVFEFQSDAELDDELRIVLGENTTDALWPMADGNCRWNFELERFTLPDGRRAKDRIAVEVGEERFPMLSEERLRSLIAQRAPWFTGRIEEINWQIAVRFERRLANRLGQGRMWLAGDAAHMTGPVGMQSMNVGLQEAYELAEIMAEGSHDGRLVDRLEDYQQHWLAEWRDLLGLEGGLEPTDETEPWITRRAGRLLSCLPASGEELARIAGQLGLKAHCGGRGRAKVGE